MKVLLFIPQRYGFFHSYKEIFEYMGAEVHAIDFFQVVKSWEKKINVQMFRLPNKFRLRWESYYMGKINAFYRERFDELKPDVIFIYNNELLLPETLAYFKKNGAKIGFFLGDSPFYTPTNRYYLQLLDYADTITTTDSFWIHQFRKMGLKNLHMTYPCVPSHQHYPVDLTESEYEELKTEVLYVGMSYTDSWGYKKAKFLNYFTDFDLHIHGNDDWERWFKDFPGLKAHYRERKEYISTEKMNKMYNATKIIPIDGNPGLLHAAHWRLMEVLGSGTLPLMEWQNGLAEIFPEGSDLPAVHSYDDIKEMTRFYLDNEEKRVEKVEWMRNFVLDKYSVKNNAQLLADALDLRIQLPVQEASPSVNA
mgnify:CR=1 FL=1